MAKTYEERNAQVAAISRERSLSGRDIHPIPKVAKPRRRSRCRKDFRRFCETYFPETFALKWSSDHLKVIERIQRSTLEGGLFAVAMPRGTGKSSLCRVGVIWALLYGHRRYVVLVGATADAARKALSIMADELKFNEHLYVDFPEVCYPIRKLGNISQRAKGQLLKGANTNISITADTLILPTVPRSCSSGSVVDVAGIESAIRGKQARVGSGEIIRPDLVIVDDPQTREHAHSPRSIQKILETFNGDILGLAGPGRKIAAVCPCTVIARGDVADKLLDRKLSPDWQGERTQLLRSAPTNVKLWEQYAELRSDGLRHERGIGAATAFYVAHRGAMDEGGEASWPERYEPGEASAIQYAMNLKLRDEASFQAEYQNAPMSVQVETPLTLLPEHLTGKGDHKGKVINLPRLMIPDAATRLTAMIDVQGTILFYTVVAVGNDFSVHVPDYGTYPRQKRNYFYLREVDTTLAHLKPGASPEGYLYDGLDKLVTQLMDQAWNRENGEPLRISRIMIDAGWSTDIVKLYCKQSQYAASLLPSFGVGIGAKYKPMLDYSTSPGERSGWNWRVEKEGHCRFDTNSWKSFIAQRIISLPGEDGTLTMYEASAQQHLMFAEHVCSEYPVQITGNGRTVNEWAKRPTRENHYLDCLVGAAVAASEQGVLFKGHNAALGDVAKRPRKKLNVKF